MVSQWSQLVIYHNHSTKQQGKDHKHSAKANEVDENNEEIATVLSDDDPERLLADVQVGSSRIIEECCHIHAHGEPEQKMEAGEVEAPLDAWFLLDSHSPLFKVVIG